MNVKLAEEIRDNPQEFSKLNFGDMLDVIPAVTADVHDRLMEFADGNKEIESLITAYSELTFFQHRQRDCDLGDIRAVQDIVNTLWGKKKGKGK